MTYIAADADVILSGGSNFDLWFDSFESDSIFGLNFHIEGISCNFEHIRMKFTHLIT